VSELEGQVALVIGAAAGIGLAASRLLAARGATVIVADRDGDVARRVASDIGGVAYQLDAASTGELRGLFEHIDARFRAAQHLLQQCRYARTEWVRRYRRAIRRSAQINLKCHFFATNLARAAAQVRRTACVDRLHVVGCWHAAFSAAAHSTRSASRAC
jgi:NAD(P)-dependent dehydrogenase (short-subunit alcohol dehydrogenase family)